MTKLTFESIGHNEAFEAKFKELVAIIDGFESDDSPVSEVLEKISQCINVLRELEGKGEIVVYAEEMALMRRSEVGEENDVIAGILPEEENVIGKMKVKEDGTQTFSLTNEEGLRKAVEMKVQE